MQPNPAYLAAGGAAEVQVAVSVKRDRLDRQRCDVVIDAGDGSGAASLSFNPGDSGPKSLRHSYRAPGSYNLRALGGHGCAGSRSIDVVVVAEGEADSKPACPAGWQLVPESVQGPRFTCRAEAPSAPLRCGTGSRYFYEKGVIGCR